LIVLECEILKCRNADASAQRTKHHLCCRVPKNFSQDILEHGDEFNTMKPLLFFRPWACFFPKCESCHLVWSLPGLIPFKKCLLLFVQSNQVPFMIHCCSSPSYVPILIFFGYRIDASFFSFSHYQSLFSPLFFLIHSFQLLLIFLCVCGVCFCISCIIQKVPYSTFIYPYFWFSVQVFV
jgi:hypothetical protein